MKFNHRSSLSPAIVMMISLVTASGCQEQSLDGMSVGKKIVNGKDPADGKNRIDTPFDQGSSSSGNATSEPIVYPEVQFRATGKANVTSPTKQSANLVHVITTSMTDTSLRILTNEWTCDRKECQEAVRGWNDETNYTTTKAVAPQGSSDTAGSMFLVFATGAKNNKGESITFSPAFPVLVIPAAASRYEQIKKMDQTYRTTVSGSGANFEMTANVAVLSSSTDDISIKIAYNIPSEPSDKPGSYYQKLPMFKTSTYTINIKDKNLTGIYAHTLAYQEKDRAHISMDNMNYRICKKTQGTKVEDFICR